MATTYAKTFESSCSKAIFVDLQINRYSERNNCVPISISQVIVGDFIYTTVLFTPKYAKNE